MIAKTDCYLESWIFSREEKIIQVYLIFFLNRATQWRSVRLRLIKDAVIEKINRASLFHRKKIRYLLMTVIVCWRK